MWLIVLLWGVVEVQVIFLAKSDKMKILVQHDACALGKIPVLRIVSHCRFAVDTPLGKAWLKRFCFNQNAILSHKSKHVIITMTTTIKLTKKKTTSFFWQKVFFCIFRYDFFNSLVNNNYNYTKINLKTIFFSLLLLLILSLRSFCEQKIHLLIVDIQFVVRFINFWHIENV